MSKQESIPSLNFDSEWQIGIAVSGITELIRFVVAKGDAIVSVLADRDSSENKLYWETYPNFIAECAETCEHCGKVTGFIPKDRQKFQISNVEGLLASIRKSLEFQETNKMFWNDALPSTNER